MLSFLPFTLSTFVLLSLLFFKHICIFSGFGIVTMSTAYLILFIFCSLMETVQINELKKIITKLLFLKYINLHSIGSLNISGLVIRLYCRETLDLYINCWTWDLPSILGRMSAHRNVPRNVGRKASRLNHAHCWNEVRCSLFTVLLIHITKVIKSVLHLIFCSSVCFQVLLTWTTTVIRTFII